MTTMPPESSNESRHLPPPGARFMNVLRWVMFGGLLLLAAISAASYVAWKRGEGAATAGASLYLCPMHPTYTSPRPGDCPICGMSLVPATSVAAGGSAGNVPGLTDVTLGPERVQAIGVRTAIATHGALADDLELAAFVAPDESAVTTVQVRVPGWIQTLHVDRTGQVVRAGQPLVTLYSPELFQSESEFLVALGAGGDAESARERLRRLGVPADEIARIERDRTASTHLTLRAPTGGTVIERRVTNGQSVGPDTPLLVLADLSRPWLLADVYEMDLPRVKVGAPVTFTSEALPGRTWRGRVEFLYPTVSSDTRTLRARIALEGATAELKPGLFGSVRVRSTGAAVLHVPSEALVRAGEHDYVFLARAGGRFEPRQVVPGREAGDRVEILRGLAAGDTVVASASFLIDSESRLGAALAGMTASHVRGDSAARPAAPAPAADPHAGHGH